jgi:DNA (cytosine-5)-methyltransferase 1
MKVIGLFSGIGGFELAFQREGFEVVSVCEIDPYCQKVLKALPKGQAESGYPLVLCGGFPCQDLSIAGRQVGLTGERSGLWLEFKRAIEEIRPDFIVIENVAHTWRRWVPSVREDLADAWVR